MPDQLAEMTKAGQYGSYLKTLKLLIEIYVIPTTGKPAPSGVLLGERKLYINRST